MKSLLTFLSITFVAGILPGHTTPQHGVSTFGTLKYPADFTHFDYTNKNAPKGGDFRIAGLGTFDSLNPFIIIGTPDASVIMTFATLLAPAYDEIASSYGYVASSVEIAPDRSFVIFNLNPKAQFDNGEPITADDIIFSFEILRDKGQPLYRSYYKNVSRAEKISNHAVKFHLSGKKSLELPSILGQLAVLSKKFFSVHDFSKTLVTPAPSSGPYRIVRTDFGRRIIFERVKNWWGENLPSEKGQNNFDRIIIDYYRDSTSMFEAFKAGKTDFRHENISKQWVTGYTFNAFKNGLVKKELTAHKNPQPTLGFAFNLRRSVFADWRVRKAISDLYDFTWLNSNLFYNQYTRSQSFFPNSPFTQEGVPAGDELALLLPFKDKLRAEIFTTPITLATHKDATETRKIKKQSLALLAKAGWHLADGKLINATTKKPLTFEFLGVDPSAEKVALYLKRCLAEIGIDMKVRTLDVGSYMERIEGYDYDMIVMGIGQSITPGNEQRTYWGTKAADLKGGQNYTGIKDPVVDSLCEKIAGAPDFKSLTTATKALDRVLMASYIMIPHYYRNDIPSAYWDRFGKPQTHPAYYPAQYTSAWWVDPTKDKLIQAALGTTTPDSSKTKSRGACTRFLAWINGLFK
ncbi:MAG: extracellular solute-binding protein [Pseudomonadota bacterium]|nr:extracellular solute-binding protein [Pseudomonadota bacterium]